MILWTDIALTHKPVQQTQEEGPEDQLPAPVIGIQDLTVKQANAQEQEDHTITQGAETQNNKPESPSVFHFYLLFKKIVFHW